MNISNSEYGKLTKKRSPNSKIYKTLPEAFLIGGAICTLGEGLINLYSSLGASEDNAAALTSMTLIFISMLLTGFELYDRIAQHAGAGTLVPITGFANSIVSPAIDFKTEGYVLGLGAKMFIIAGPVIVYGLSASVIYGVIYYVVGLFMK